MAYPEFLIAPMREELTRLGVEELRTAAEVDHAIDHTDGTVMFVVNSVCGCAAGRARPGIALALQHHTRPERVVTVFAGADIEATARARERFTGMPASSPSVAFVQRGELVYMMHRHQIEMRSAEEIAEELKAAFDKFCVSPAVAQ